MLLWQRHPVAAEDPHSTLNGTPTCNSPSSTALCEIQVAGQEESGGVDIEVDQNSKIILSTVEIW